MGTEENMERKNGNIKLEVLNSEDNAIDIEVRTETSGKDISNSRANSDTIVIKNVREMDEYISGKNAEKALDDYIAKLKLEDEEIAKSKASANGESINSMSGSTAKNATNNTIAGKSKYSGEISEVSSKTSEVIDSEEHNNVKRRISLSDEILKISSNITFEYSKTIGNLDYSKIKSYIVEDGDKTVSFLFYENDFYAVNRINYPEGYMYSEKDDKLPSSENLNKIIRKIPNVAKSRNILHIENIEARIYDMTEYILLLEREKIRVIKVSDMGNLAEMTYKEYPIDLAKLEENVNILEDEEYEREKAEKSLKNKIKSLGNAFKNHVVYPIKETLIKIGLISDVKMLSDGKHSVFEKK